MTCSSMIALFGTMFVLALIPGASVLAVSAGSMAFGWRHGVITTLGIVVGDIFFIILAISGLSVLEETMGRLFVLIRYLGGAYLVVLGMVLWRFESREAEVDGVKEASLWSGFFTGLLITLADVKAIFFYLMFFPAFLDLSSISVGDMMMIVVIAAIAISVAKLSYACVAHRAMVLFESVRARTCINRIAGTVMAGVGLFLTLRA